MIPFFVLPSHNNQRDATSQGFSIPKSLFQTEGDRAIQGQLACSNAHMQCQEVAWGISLVTRLDHRG